MAYPAFMAEMGQPAARPKLWFGVWSGYSVAVAFAALAVAGHVQGLVALVWPLYLLVGIKVVTNTLAYVSLKREVLVLESNGINMFADIVLMTGAIYLTGGQVSPLFPIYVIEITVIALLTNLGITLMVFASVIACYAAMAVLVFGGVLPAQPAPIAVTGSLNLSYLITDLVYAVFVMGVPTVFTVLIMKLLRQRERELEARTAELIDAGKQRSQFLVNVTHELRTPMHGILGTAEVLSSGVYGPVTEKQATALERIRTTGSDLVQLVDDLLQLSKHDAGKLEYVPSEVDLVELLPQVESSVKQMLGRNKQLSVTTELDDELPVIVTDRRKLNQVLINLVSNALKFTPDGGHVVLRACCAGAEHVELSVQDDGPGIAPADQERIFEEFQQAHDSTLERDYGGVGIGLPLVKRLLSLMGGEIRVDSAPGQGATFTVTLPRRH